MADDPFRDLAGADAPRPLPDGLRARLEARLTGDPIEELRHADGPRELPARAYARVEAALRGLDGPRPMPARTYARVEAALLARRSARRASAVLGTAASVVLLVALVALAFRGGPGAGNLPPAAAPRPGAGTTSAPAASGTPEPTPSPATAPPGVVAVPPAPSRTRFPGGSSAGGAPGSAGEYTGPPPPFTYPSGGYAPSMPRPAPQAGASEPEPPPPAPPANPQPLYVGLYGGADPADAGFRTYVDLLNESGGIHGRPLRLVPPGTRPVVATVNLTDDTVAGATGARPLLEGLNPPDAALRGDVFGFATAAERQAGLAVDAVFPDPEPTASAVVYSYDQGVFGDEVPRAYERALAAKGVRSVRVTITRGTYATAYPPGTDAAFLSMPLEGAAQWFRNAAAAGFAPRLGVTSIGVHHDELVLPSMPAGTKLLSPYEIGSSNEAFAIQRRGGFGIGQSKVHGWVTAKALAVALWRSRADTPAEVAGALRDLRRYDTGFFPPYATREGTTSRTPDGLLYEVVVQDGRRSFAPRSGFRSTD